MTLYTSVLFRAFGLTCILCISAIIQGNQLKLSKMVNNKTYCICSFPGTIKQYTCNICFFLHVVQNAKVNIIDIYSMFLVMNKNNGQEMAKKNNYYSLHYMEMNILP